MVYYITVMCPSAIAFRKKWARVSDKKRRGRPPIDPLVGIYRRADEGIGPLRHCAAIQNKRPIRMPVSAEKI